MAYCKVYKVRQKMKNCHYCVALASRGIAILESQSLSQVQCEHTKITITIFTEAIVNYSFCIKYTKRFAQKRNIVVIGHLLLKRQNVVGATESNDANFFFDSYKIYLPALLI